MAPRLLAGALAVLVLAMACSAAPGLKFKTACPRIPGYEYVADLAVNYDSVVTVDMKDTLTEALAACTADPNCKQFNSNFEVYTTLEVAFVKVAGVCTYLKIDCPSVAGYRTLPRGSTFTATAGTIKSSTLPAVDCAAASDCIGFTSDKFVTASSINDVSVAWTNGANCAYMVDPCPRRFGFEVLYDTVLTAGVGLDGVDNGYWADSEKAASYCQIIPKCSAYSTDGNYYVGGISTQEAKLGTCSYLKHPCPPIVNFTAYEDSSNLRNGSKDFLPDATYPSLCFADMARLCAEDPKCTIFDTMRNVWKVDFVHANVFPGMCTYAKVAGLFDGLTGVRRRRSAMAAGKTRVADKMLGEDVVPGVLAGSASISQTK